MLRYVLVAFILFDIASAFTIDDCPVAFQGSDYLQFHNGRCYYFFLHRKEEYADAGDLCHSQGGVLAMVKSSDVNEFLHEKLAYDFRDVKSDKRVWIGLSDLEKEGHFKWADGSAMKYQNFHTLEGPRASPLHFLALIEDCVAMDSTNGKWYDYKCESSFMNIDDEHRPFICEFDPVEREQTTTMITTPLSLGNQTTES